MVKYEVMAPIGKFKDQDGNEKTRWRQIGVVIAREGKPLSMKLDLIPVNFDGWVQLVEPRSE